MASADRPPSGWRAARFWKPLEAVAACLALVLWLGAMSLWVHLDATRPAAPDPGAGRVYAQNTHGSIVYLNRGEKFTLDTLMWSGGVAFAVGVAIDLWVAPFRRRKTRGHETGDGRMG